MDEWVWLRFQRVMPSPLPLLGPALCSHLNHARFGVCARMLFVHCERTNKTDIMNMQQELQNMRATYQLNTEKLEYNYQVRRQPHHDLE